MDNFILVRNVHIWNLLNSAVDPRKYSLDPSVTARDAQLRFFGFDTELPVSDAAMPAAGSVCDQHRACLVLDREALQRSLNCCVVRVFKQGRTILTHKQFHSILTHEKNLF